MTGRPADPSTVPGADLAALVRRRHDVLRDNAAAARDGDVDGVHQARVASRRLREVVPVLGVGLDDIRLKPLGRRLRDLTRALGPVRELDVALDMIASLPSGDDTNRARLQDAWARWIGQSRREPVRALRKALAPEMRGTLERQLDAFEQARAASDDGQWRGALARQLATRADDLRDRIEATGALYHPEPLHEVRIAAKKLRYALELTDDAGLVPLARQLRTLKKTQDGLGRLHDLDVLLGLLRAMPHAMPGEALHDAATDTAADLEHESRLLHARYLRARTALVHLTDTTLDAIVPRVLTGTARRARARAITHAR